MISIVFAILLGIGFTVVASQNPGNVTLTMFDTIFTLPLYLFTALSFLTGIFISSIFHLFDSLGAAFDVNDRETQIKALTKENRNLQEQMQGMINENMKLKEELGKTKEVVHAQKVENTKQNFKNFFGRIRQSLT